MAKIYTTYIVKCKDDSYYTGVTNNLDRRLGEHNSGDFPHTYCFRRRPVVLMFYQEFFDVKEAIAFEKQIKGWARAKKEALIRGDFPALVVLSRSKSKKE